MKLQNLFRRVLSLVLCLVTVLSFASVMITPARAYASPSKGTINVTAKPAYNINLDGAPLIGRIASFHIGHDYIYVTVRDGANTRIYKLIISGNTAYYKLGTRVAEQMTLLGGGICETLDMYNYNGKAYFLIGAKAKNDVYTWYPNTQIARMEFQAGATISYESLKRLIYMNYAASYYDKTEKKVVSAKDGDTLRVAAAVCGEKTIVRVHMKPTSGEDVVRFAVYDTKLLNQALDASTTAGLKLNSEAATKA